MKAIERVPCTHLMCSFAGSYTGTQGITAVHQDIADYISQRDGYPTTYEDIFLTNGGAEGIEVRQIEANSFCFLFPFYTPPPPPIMTFSDK